jgi:Ca2+-binding RTX toxin-like protein
VLEGGAGGDYLSGGIGIDTIVYNGAVGVTVDLAALTASGGEALGDTIEGDIENVNGTSAGDTFIGSAAANQLKGFGGNDVLAGRGGDDILHGGAGLDILDGGTEADSLYGGADRDILTGGTGADRFVFSAIADSMVGTGADRITDFSHAQGDRIDLSAIDANTGVAGNQAFTFIGVAAFTHHAGELGFSQSGGVTTVSGDVDGDGVADFAVTLTGMINLAIVDFAL